MSIAALGRVNDAFEKRCERKTQRIGYGLDRKGAQKLKEGQVLNRVIRRTNKGFE